MRIAEVFHSIQGEGAFAGTPTVFVRTTGCNLRCWFCDTPYTSWDPEGIQRPWRDVLDEVLGYDCEHVDITGGEPLLQPEVVPLSTALREHGRFVTFETAGTVDRPVHADLMSISPKLANSTPHSPLSTLHSHPPIRHEPPRAHNRPGSGEEGKKYQRNHGNTETRSREEIVRQRDRENRRANALSASPSLTSKFKVQSSMFNVRTPSARHSQPSTLAQRHEALRDNPQVIRRLLADFDHQLKFVIDTPDDLPDVEAWLKRFPQVAPQSVFLMPQAVTAEDLHRKTHWLETEANRRGWRVSPRLHIELFGNARGK